ncbi:MAG: DUF4188 domain-containing protein [Chloroflexi bacterium]|nr:DUF4188 domain-containing protein [Chloroflexota bacterium]
MAKLNRQRVTAEVDGEFVVFMIGMRVNRPWKVHRWLPVFMAMPKMLKELSKHPEMGLLGYRQHLANPLSPMVVQYWRSFEHLERFSRSKDSTHFPAWVSFNKRVGSNGDVGIWHETYRVAAGQFECVYNNMPDYGLAKATKIVPAAGRKATAAGRLGYREGDVAPVDESGVVAEALPAEAHSG